MQKILIAATAAVLATGAGLFGASAADKLKVGFIYLGPVGDLGWTYQHDLGRLAMVKEFGDKVETTFLENVSEGPDSERSIEQLARAGNKLIFTTSFGYMEPTLKVAKKYPNVHFEHATGYKRDKNMSTYSGRFYEGRYIQGIIAAKMSKSGVLGYIASFPIPGSDLRHQRHHPRRADDQSQHQDQDHLGQHLVRSRQGSRRRQGADRPGRRRHHAAHRQPGRDAGRRRARQAGVRPGFRNDQVRAEDAAHLDHEQLGALLYRARQGRARRHLEVGRLLGRPEEQDRRDGALHQHARRREEAGEDTEAAITEGKLHAVQMPDRRPGRQGSRMQGRHPSRRRPGARHELLRQGHRRQDSRASRRHAALTSLRPFAGRGRIASTDSKLRKQPHAK